MRCCSWKSPVAVVLMLGLVAGAVWATGEAEQAALPEREMIANVWGEMQEKPEYGGPSLFSASRRRRSTASTTTTAGPR